MTRPTRADPAGRVYLDLRSAARATGRGTQDVFIFYALERFLYRVSISEYADRLILKGGLLLAVLEARRPTRDADFLAQAIEADQQSVLTAVQAVASLPVDDGVTYATDQAVARAIRESDTYAGVRITMPAQIAGAVVKLSLDINIGDPVTPGVQRLAYPQILAAGTFPLMAYPIETVIAEKLCTAVELEDTNTRDRDYLDLYRLTGLHTFDSSGVTAALTNTAAHRDVNLRPLAQVLIRLGELRQASYSRLRQEAGPDGAALPDRFSDVVAGVMEFADPLLGGAVDAATWDPAARRWLPVVL